MSKTENESITLSARPVEGFNPSINGFRGLCALFVFGFHIFNAGIVDWSSDTLIGQGAAFLAASTRFGVEMFFMISGFVIVGSLLRHGSLKRFYQDRFVRIYALWLPLHLAICAVGPVAGWRVFSDGYGLHWLSLAVANIFLLPPIIPYPSTHPASWSLSYEWLFYLGAGLVWWIGSKGMRKTAGTTAVVLFAAAVIAMPRSLFFATGVLVYLNRERLPKWDKWLRFPTVSLVIFLVAWGMTEAGIVSPFYQVEAWLNPMQSVYAAVALFASLHCFASVTARHSALSDLLERPTFQFLGNISFSFYLVSGMVMFAVKKVTLASLGATANPAQLLAVFAIVSFSLSLVLSWGTRVAFEQKFAKLMRKWIRGKENQRLSHAADTQGDEPFAVDVPPIVVSGRNP